MSETKQSVAEKKVELYHVGSEPIEDLFQRIDNCGGWPPNSSFIAVHHSLQKQRPCEFMDRKIRNPWWTTIATSDDYYLWKLSDEAILKIKNEARVELIEQIPRKLKRGF